MQFAHSVLNNQGNFATVYMQALRTPDYHWAYSLQARK